MDNIKLLKQFGTVVKLTEYALKLTNELMDAEENNKDNYNDILNNYIEITNKIEIILSTYCEKEIAVIVDHLINNSEDYFDSLFGDLIENPKIDVISHYLVFSLENKIKETLNIEMDADKFNEIPDMEKFIKNVVYTHKILKNINTSLNIDFLIRYLKELNKKINNEEYSYCKKELLKEKYNLIFMSHELFNKLGNTFIIKDKYESITKEVAQEYKLENNELIKNASENFNLEGAVNQISELIETDNVYYLIREKRIEMIKRQSALLANLLELSNDTIIELYSFYDELASKNIMNTESIKLIDEAMNVYKKEKSNILT